MYIQFDREDPDNLAGFTFDNSEEDKEQMTDFLSWLDTLKLTYNKLKIKVPGSSEKMNCIIINKQIKKEIKTNVIQPVIHSEVQSQTINDSENKEDSDSESESENDNNEIKTKKTTKKITRKV